MHARTGEDCSLEFQGFVVRIRLKPSREKHEFCLWAVEGWVPEPGQSGKVWHSPFGGIGRNSDADIWTWGQALKENPQAHSAVRAQEGLRGPVFPMSVSLSLHLKGTTVMSFPH